jgi:threonylcarbamoyladenosine tRNA methylthiotransferase MtaB
MNDKIAHDVKKKRTAILIEQGDRKKRAFFENYLNKTRLVLFEQKNRDGNWTGYTSNYIQVALKSDKNLHNKIVPVLLVSVNGKQMMGIRN